MNGDNDVQTPLNILYDGQEIQFLMYLPVNRPVVSLEG
jgi:hypothetical protein